MLGTKIKHPKEFEGATLTAEEFDNICDYREENNLFSETEKEAEIANAVLQEKFGKAKAYLYCMVGMALVKGAVPHPDRFSSARIENGSLIISEDLCGMSLSDFIEELEQSELEQDEIEKARMN